MRPPVPPFSAETAAQKVRAQDINFMARYGRGLICLTLTRDRCRQLRLPLMVSDTDLD